MSKLGVHVSAGNRRGFGAYLLTCAEAGHPVPVIMAVDQDVWPDVARYSPSTIVVYRHQPKDRQGQGLDGPPGIYTGDPVASARAWLALLLPNWQRNRATYYAPLNEQDPPTLAAFAWLDAFTLECLRLADQAGVKLALYAFSAGNPKHLLDAAGAVLATPDECWVQLVPSLRYAAQHGHVLLLHEYGFDAPAGNGGPTGSLRASAPHLALRYRAAYQTLYRYDATPRLIVSEASASVGARPAWGMMTRDQWLADAQWYDRELMRDAAVLGCCLYQVGGAEDLSEVLPALAGYTAATPTPDPEADPVVGVVVEPPPPIGRQYDRVVHLVPPNVPTTLDHAGYRAIVERAGEARASVTASADDAFVNPPECRSRTVVVYNVAAWGGRAALEDWVQAWYPPVPTIHYVEV